MRSEERKKEQRGAIVLLVATQFDAITWDRPNVGGPVRGPLPSMYDRPVSYDTGTSSGIGHNSAEFSGLHVAAWPGNGSLRVCSVQQPVPFRTSAQTPIRLHAVGTVKMFANIRPSLKKVNVESTIHGNRAHQKRNWWSPLTKIGGYLALCFSCLSPGICVPQNLDSPYRQCRDEVSLQAAEILYLRGYVDILVKTYPEVKCEFEIPVAEPARIREKIRQLRRKLKEVRKNA